MPQLRPQPQCPGIRLLFLALFLTALMTACASPTAQERGQRMDVQADARGWHKLRLPAGRWVFTAYASSRQAQPGVPLTVYLEGDGSAWRTGTQPSDDPTPHNPVALAMALQHPQGAVAYLARPCQNVRASDWGSCSPADWTHARYAPDVVAAMDTALNALKERAGAQQVVLVGYSGGGAVAALLAAQRRDVTRLVTVAGNLDTDAWTALHRVLPLRGSLNPADQWRALENLPQLHFVGDQDAVVPQAVVRAFAQRFPAGRQPAIRLVSGANHGCCWAQQWPALAREAFP